MQPKFKLIVCEEKEIYSVKNEVELNNQHDKLFKDLFNHKDEVKKFIKNYIKINIKDAEIEKCSNSYISSNYKNYEADIVYKIRDNTIYFSTNITRRYTNCSRKI